MLWSVLKYFFNKQLRNLRNPPSKHTDRLTNPPPKEVQDLVESVRVPLGSHEPEAHFDEKDAEADNP